MDETRRRKLKQSILLFVIVVSLYAGLSSSIESFSVDEAENLEHVIDIEKRQANGVSLTPHADVTTVNPRTDSCDLPCMNGGRCTGRNICHCYHPFSGYRCLYRTDFSMDHTEVGDLEADISTKMCSLFGPGNILTFDGLFYDFPGLCQYEMVSSAGQPDFKKKSSIGYIKKCQITNDYNLYYIILVRKNPNCAQNGQYVYDTGLCNVKITIYAAASQVKFTITDTEVTFQNKPIALPHDENGVILMKIWPYTTFILGDLTLRYDHTSGSVGVILLSDTYQNKTFGLCGNFNGISSDDLVTRQGATVSGGVKGHIVAKTWIERDVNENCLDVAMLEENIDECRERSDVTRICNILWSYFTDCHHHLNPSKFYDVCKTELCRCNYTIRADCQCEVITLYSRHCAIAGGKVTDWRTDSRCPRSCSYEQVWQECGKESPQTCEMPHLLPNQPCFDRCQCSVGLYEHGTQCTILPNCPCVHRNVEYKPGDVTSIYNCNECICNAGQWDCSIAMCPGQTHVVGFDHFKTYDDKFFTFPGRCQYIFSEDCVDGTFTMYIENTECGTDAGISCIKSFTIKFTIKGQRQEVTLREGEIVTINNYDVKLPFQSGDLQISRESSIYINVRHAFTGIDVLWDGYSNIYVTVPTHYAGKLCGLAGNYNGNAGDDFTAKNGMLQSTAVAFSNSWRLQSCDFVTTEIPDPCIANNYKKPQAQAACAQIYGEKFFPCHDEIEPEHYYENCLYEYCECTREINDECMCDSLAVYVRKCATKGIDLDWRSPDFCHLPCRGGQVYKRCGSGCDKSCRSLSTPESCNDRCVEGCNCPDNYYLSPAGSCVRPDECPCYHVNTWYRPGQTIPAPGILCQCIRGRLECEGEGTLPSICPPGEIFYNCSQVAMTGQLRGAECSKTCFNKDLPCPLTLCVSGCGCPHGYVRHDEKCILPHDCPCFHNNKGYENGSLIEVDCNQCTCLDGQWSCTRKICGGECSVTGESHIKTFDHKWFDFRGGCEYILATDECRSVNGSFKVVYKTNPCETMGHVCWRTVKLTLGRNQIVLEKDRVPQETSLADSNGLDIPYKISSHGFFTFIKTGIGLTVLWDGATRIYLQLASFYHDKVCGLCGNFDGLENNDFLLRSQDIVTSSSVFGHNWRTKDYCPMRTVPKCLDMCAQYPQRKAWAIEQCRVIESDLFKECREEIDHQKYLDHCLYDTCSCGSGGDCECFCTAVATYAHACAQIGIYVEWRTPTLCPTMCELYNKNDSCEWHFEACGTSCPETCCDHKNQVNCNSPCVEGCFPRCQHGHVFSEEQQTCIPLEECEVCPPTTTVVPGTPSVTMITTKTPVPNTTATTITTPLTAPVCSQFCLDNSNVKRRPGEIWFDEACQGLECTFFGEECLTMRRRDDISSSCPLSLTCPLYKISRKVEYDDPGEDPDPCCEELECVCRDNMYLSRNCPKWNSTFNCRSPFEMPIYNGIYPNTDGCCSDFSCVCRTNEELSKLCSEWNKTCGLNEVRIEVETRTCCPSYICECVYVTVNNKQYEVGDEFPNADDQNCSKFRVISTNLGDCPTIEKIPVKECAQEPICGQCQTKTKLRDDKCCGEIYQCVDKQCPPSQDSCKRDQKRVLASNTTCCRTYDCRCTCSGFGSPTVETFNCNQTFEFTGNCTYLVSKGIGSDAYHVSAENVFCSDIYPSSSFAINQMCIKKMIVRYFSLVFQIFPADGTVLVNDQPATGYDQVGVNLEIETGTFSTGNRVTSISLRINDIGLVVTYNNPTIAFNPNAIGVFTIDLSSTFPTNGTKGLCGNCTRDFGDVEYECPELAPIQQEDFIEDVTCPTPCGVNDTCEEDRCNGIGSCGVCRDCKYFGHADPCLVLDNVVFDECHQSTGVSIDMIRSLCQSRQSQCFQENEENSTIATQCNPCFFTFIQQYIASCESTGFCSTYRTALGCPNDTSSCPHNQVYEHCVDDCFVQRSCSDVATGTASSTGQCGVNFVSQCVCPNGFVFKTPDSEECINETCCCDEDPTCIETNPNFVPIANGTDDCGCTIFTGQCECHGCFDEEGKFRTPGETWERGCTKCTCQRSLLDNCFAIASQPILSCPDLKPCPDDKNYVAVLGPMENCCPTQTCECKYITVGDQQYSVGDEFPNADDQNCSKFRVISTNLGDCPTIEKIPVKECAQEPICGQCQTKTKLRDDKCCGEIYQCVDKQCPPSQDSCRRDQKRVLASNTTCCRTYDCRCTCSGFGSPTVETFNCNQTFEFTGNCTYLVSKGIGSDAYHVSAENVFCSDIYPSSSFAINQMCIKQMIVRYFSLVFQIFPADGTVLVNDQPTTGYDQVGVNLEIETGTFSTGNRVTSISLRINDIGLVVAYNNPTIAFNPNVIGVFTIDLSSTFPTNGTKGLCGNCTRDFEDVDYECPELAPIQQEDFIEDVTCPTPCGVNDTCEEDRCNGIGSCGVCRDCEYFGHADPCLVLDNVVFDECHQSMGMSIDMIRSLCQSRQSHCFQENEENSTIATQCNPCFFTFIQQYIASCESAGFCSTYRTALGCPNDTSSCPHNQVYEHCVDDCFVQRSCSDVATGVAPSTGQCEVNFIPQCVCPNGLVLKSADSDKCINESCCNCPNPPVCEEGFNFSPVQIDIDLCDCPIYSTKCECTPLCINLVSGDIMLQNEEITSEDGCGKYICPPYDSSSNPSGTCDDIVFAYYQRNPCPVNDTCDHNMVAKYSFRSDECCPTIHCECPETKVPVCENKYEVIENTTGNCPTPVCVCKCPSIVANCSSSPGCKVLITKASPDGCGCPVEFKCEPDSNLCPKAPECSSCQQLTVAEYVPGSEACEANCSVYRCIAKSCKTLPMSSISCLEYQEKIAYFADNDTDECCPVHDCRCKPSSILKDECPQWEFQCEPDFIKKRTNPIEDCCPDYICECNQAICPAPIDCQLLTLNTTWPSPKANGTHEDVCCATFSCTCEDVGCPPEVKTCPKYQKMDKRNNTINPCCPVYTCICDPSQIPANYSFPQIQPSSSGKCNLPGQIPQPVYDETGCVAECVCYPIYELRDHCTEYRTLQATCTEPQQLFPLAVSANDLDHICCPKVECRCPECGSDYVSRETLENKLKPLQIIIPEGEITACCQKYQVICNPLSNTAEFCKQYNPTCESGYKQLRHPENKECCPSTYCECDLDLCETTPECIPPQKLESTNSTNGCCKDYRCTCPEDSNENMTCTHPKVASYTNTSCPEKYCACPKKCPLDPIIDCQNKPGCRPVVSYRDEDCGCAINSTCIADPSNCNSPPVCPICYSAVEVDTILIVGDCNSTCPKYECQRNICPTPVPLPPLCSWNRLVSNNSNPCCPVDFPVCVPSLCPPIKCEPGYIKVTRDREFYDDENNCSPDLHCCPKSECICTVCKHNLSLYEPGQEWNNDLAPCETFYCSGNKSEDGCYTVYSKPATCTIQSENNTVFHVPVGGYMQTEDPCKSKVCKQNGLGSNCSANLIESIVTCPARPVCNQFQFLETIAQQNVCCPSYKCVCMQCGEDYQQFPTRHMENYEILVPMTLEQNPNQICCPQMLYTCAEGIIVSEVCPNWNMTCLAGKELTRLNAITECCPIYECICQECPEETPVTITHACEEEVLMTIEDNPLQECCPATKIVCREDQSCCGESYVTYDSLYQSLNLAEEIITVLSNHTCCPLHLPFCGEGAELSEVCEPYNIKCPTGYRRQRNDSDFGCCHTYYCVCDQTLCTPKPQCSPPKEYKLSAVIDSCCKLYDCVCPTDDNATIKCTSPEQVFYTESVCPKKYCRCPEELNCPVNADLEACREKPGCRPTVERDRCGCINHTQCHSDATFCPVKPTCGTCMEPVEAGLLPSVGNCTSTCKNYVCDRVSCPEVIEPSVCSLRMIVTTEINCCPAYRTMCKEHACPSVTCKPGFQAQFNEKYYDNDPRYKCGSDSFCCPKIECVCNSCFYNGEIHSLNNVWVKDEDPCLEHYCSSDRDDQGCYTAITRPPKCSYNNEEYSIGSIIRTNNTCTNLVCEVDYSSTTCDAKFETTSFKCPDAPFCNQFYVPKSNYKQDRCCPQYECVCNKCGMDYFGPGPGRDLEWYEKAINLTLEENENQYCCPMVNIVCDEDILYQCPDANVTCEVGQEKIEINSTHPCCPKYDCVCKKCCNAPPIDESSFNDCQEIVEIPPSRNPNYMCCPQKEIACKKVESCCNIPDCGPYEVANRTSEMDPTKSYCCPLYECVCNGKCPSGYITKEQLQMELKVGQELMQNSPEDPCCPTYKVVCAADAEYIKDCDTFNMECSSPYVLRRHVHDEGCCAIYSCQCDQTLCPQKPYCEPPSEAIYYSTSNDGCCQTYQCFCPPDRNDNLTCISPEIIAFTKTVCPTKFCRCPTSLECPVNAAVNCTSKPGCKATVTKRDSCGCARSVTCEEDPSLCPIPPVCGKCFQKLPVTVPAKAGDCESTCAMFRCDRIKCPPITDAITCSLHKNVRYLSDDWCCPRIELACVLEKCPKLTCSENSVKVIYDEYVDSDFNCSSSLNCCRREECVCNVCHHNGSVYNLYESWRSPHDICLKYDCTQRRGEDGCFVVNTGYPSCVYNDEHFPVNSVLETDYPCVILKCVERIQNGVCAHAFVMERTKCQSPPECGFFHYPKSVSVKDECCPHYVCECNECPTQYLVPLPLRELEWYETTRNQTLDENPLQVCCPLVKIICHTEVLDQCPDYNKTCSYGKERVEKSSKHPCCSEYDCKCKECRERDEPTVNDLYHCEEIVLKSLEENPNSECCPEYKVTCQNQSCCPIPSCKIDEEIQATSVSNPYTNGCCPQYECKCKPAQELSAVCKFANFTCDVGFKRVRNNSETECCPTYTCKCESCVMDNIPYPIGSSWIDPVDHCVVRECIQIGIACPIFNSRKKYECETVNATKCLAEGGQLIPNKTTGGCCNTCKSCALTDHFDFIGITNHQPGVNCSLAIPINLPYCDGTCSTSSEYNIQSGTFDSICRCCQVVKSQKITYGCFCTDGSFARLEIDHATECACQETECGKK